MQLLQTFRYHARKSDRKVLVQPEEVVGDLCGAIGVGELGEPGLGVNGRVELAVWAPGPEPVGLIPAGFFLSFTACKYKISSRIEYWSLGADKITLELLKISWSEYPHKQNSLFS